MTRPGQPTRRQTLALAGASVALPFLQRAAFGSPPETLALFGPPAGPSITLAHAVRTDMLADLTSSASFTAWSNPDELRAGLTSGTIRLSVVPVQAAANLYNRGFPIRLANIMTEGLLYIVTGDPEITSVGDLAGRTIAVPFRGDTPDIILGQLLADVGIDPETGLTQSFTGTPVEAMQLLLAGRADAALVGEPAASAAILRGRQAGIEILRGIDIQTAWGEMTGGPSVLPQAGLAVTQDFLDAHGDVMTPLLAALQRAVADVLADPEAAAGHATEALGLPSPVIAAAIPHSRLVASPASGARAEIEAMLTAMAGDGMERIGGRMPDDGLYL